MLSLEIYFKVFFFQYHVTIIIILALVENEQINTKSKIFISNLHHANKTIYIQYRFLLPIVNFKFLSGVLISLNNLVNNQ